MRKIGILLTLLVYLGTGCATNLTDIKSWETQGNIELLILALKHERANIRQGAAKSLARIGAPAVKHLITALRDEDPCVRGVTTEALGHIGDEQAVQPLIAALIEENACIRGATAEALANIGTPAVKPLIGALNNKNLYVREAAAGALDKIGWQPKDTPEEVLFLLAYRKWKVINKLGAPAIEPLIALLRDDKRDDRWEIARTLADIGKPSIDPLVISLQDGRIRGAAAWVLAHIGKPAVKPLIKALQDGRIRRAALKALAKIGKPAVEPLIANLKDYDAWVRSNVATTLGEIGDKRAVKPLTTAFKDKNWRVRKSVAKALEKLLVSKH